MENKEYKKKPVVVQAYQAEQNGEIKTLEGVMQYHKGDYIITGVKGEQYPCREDIFKETYEPLERIPEETKIDKTSTREVYDKFHNEYTYIVDYASVLMDKHFPKGESKERSKALVFNGELIHYMMLVMNGVVERLTDKIKTIDKGVDTKSQSGEREALLKTDRYICKKCALGLVIETSGIRHWRCPSCSSLNYEENYLENRLEKEFDSKLSESKKEGYQNGCKDMLEDTKAKIVIFIESESGKSGRKEIIKFIKSLK